MPLFIVPSTPGRVAARVGAAESIVGYRVEEYARG
jgi:hypothetical protein